ncbi:MAG: ribonuclease III [Acidobacteria bacterium]|nr:ribonuclease III [Acidobacteriota bacterium]
MTSSPKLTQLEERIGYRFNDRSHAELALTHSSYAQEAAAECGYNERLEFLGDSVLGFVVSADLVAQFPEESEGGLTQLKAYLVSASHLEHEARRLDLGVFLRLGRGEERSGGRDKKGVLVDAFEALIAAVYLDGGVAAAEAFIRGTVLLPDVVEAARKEVETANYKSALQEWLQARKLPLPVYSVASTSGRDHRRWFHVDLRVGSDFTATAEGWTKRSAEQEAARQGLDFFQQQYTPDAVDLNPGKRDTGESDET